MRQTRFHIFSDSKSRKTDICLRYLFTCFILLSLNFLSISEENEITGYVTNGVNNIPFALVRVQATTNFSTADFQGRFVLKNISSTDTLVITAWAEGYYNGDLRALPGDSNIVITLHHLPSEDNPNYEFFSPDPDTTSELNCGNCHADVLMNQWRNNAHGQSARNPFFYAMYNGTDIDNTPNVGVGYKLDFPQTNGNCATCHIPGAAINNPWGINPNEVIGTNQNGVFCDFCHKIYNTLPSDGQGTTGTLSIEMLRPPEDGQMFFGPYDDIHEPDSYLPLIRKSEFCAPCHTGKFWGIPAYDCFPEWQASPYPSLDIQCQTCHMYPDGVTTNFAPGKGGLERDPLTIPSHLQPGSRDPEILSNSVTMNIHAEQINDSIKVMVTIYNDKTGHHVPTGRPSRNMILLVEANENNSIPLTFLDGETVPSWGGEGDILDGNYAGLTGKGFAKILMDNLTGLAPAPSWRPTQILSDNRIAAFNSDTSYYFFRTPSISSIVTIQAKLIYRRFFKEWADEKKFDIPDITMEEESINLLTVPVTSVQDEEYSKNSYSLSQNYPNPFNPSTTIKYSIPQGSHVLLEIYDLLGRKVKLLTDEFKNPGNYEMELRCDELSSGIYLYRIQAGDFVDTKKLLLLK